MSKYGSPVRQLAYDNGCPRPNGWNFRSAKTFSGAWTEHPCFDNLSSRLRSRKYTGVQHFTLTKCRQDPIEKLECLCIVRERKKKDGTEPRWALDRIHAVGECPHSEYTMKGG